MKLICELTEDIGYVTENTEGNKKKFFIEGIFMVAGTKNKNGRIYPNSVMEKEVERYVKEMVADNRAYGELGHPSGPSIIPTNISHRITELKMDGNNVYGKALISNTPNGNIVKGIMEDGGKFGVSSRGMGNLKENKDGIMEVQDDFRLSTAADVVIDPSAPGAFVKGIMEDVEWFYDATKGTYMQVAAEKLIENVKKMSHSQLNEQKMNIWKTFLDSLVINHQ